MEEVKMFLFARWMATCYADEHIDEKMRHTSVEGYDQSTEMSVLNRESVEWWKKQLQYFNEEVYPNYIKNGSVDNAMEFFDKKSSPIKYEVRTAPNGDLCIMSTAYEVRIATFSKGTSVDAENIKKLLSKN